MHVPCIFFFPLWQGRSITVCTAAATGRQSPVLTRLHPTLSMDGDLPPTLPTLPTTCLPCPPAPALPWWWCSAYALPWRPPSSRAHALFGVAILDPNRFWIGIPPCISRHLPRLRETIWILQAMGGGSVPRRGCGLLLFLLLTSGLSFLRKDNQRKGKSEWVWLSHGLGKPDPERQPSDEGVVGVDGAQGFAHPRPDL